jgi:hypothetical protein
MSAVGNTPTNLNFLSPLNFTFFVRKCPHVNFFCQAVNIPGFGAPTTPQQGSPFITFSQTYDHLEFNDLVCTFKVHEDMMNYLELYSWMKGIGFPESYEQYAELAEKPVYSEMGLRSDILVQILDSNQQPKFDFNFHDAQPLNIGNMQLDTRTVGDIPFITLDVTFKYNGFNFSRVT